MTSRTKKTCETDPIDPDDEPVSTTTLSPEESRELETLRRWLNAATGPAVRFAVRKMIDSSKRPGKRDEAILWQRRVRELREHVRRAPNAVDDRASLDACRAAKKFITTWWVDARRPSSGLVALSEALRLFARPGGAKSKASPAPGSESKGT